MINARRSDERAKAVTDLVFEFQTGKPVSKAQLDSYSDTFCIALMPENVVPMTQTICSARASAWREATARLPLGDDDKAQWIDEPLVDDAPFFELAERAPIPLAQSDVRTFEPTA